MEQIENILYEFWEVYYHDFRFIMVALDMFVLFYNFIRTLTMIFRKSMFVIA